MSNTRRLLVSLLLLSIALIPPGLFLLQTGVRDAPLTLGNHTPDDTDRATLLPSELAFNTNRNGHWDLMRLLPDGTLINLTDDASDAEDYFPSWSLRGETINFLANRGNPDEPGPAQVSVDGSGLRSLSSVGAIISLVQAGLFDWDPKWSPDGEMLLWASLRDVNLELYTIPTAADFEMANARQLTRRSARDWFPAWSPDGSAVAFASDAAGNEDIYLLHLADTTLTQLTDHPADDIYPMWSADGQQILFVSERDTSLVSGDLRLYLMPADDPGSVEPLAADATFRGGDTWHADGRYAAFISNESGTWQIYLRDSDSGEVQQLTTEGDNLFPVWRP